MVTTVNTKSGSKVIGRISDSSSGGFKKGFVGSVTGSKGNKLTYVFDQSSNVVRPGESIALAAQLRPEEKPVVEVQPPSRGVPFPAFKNTLTGETTSLQAQPKPSDSQVAQGVLNAANPTLRIIEAKQGVAVNDPRNFVPVGVPSEVKNVEGTYYGLAPTRSQRFVDEVNQRQILVEQQAKAVPPSRVYATPERSTVSKITDPFDTKFHPVKGFLSGAFNPGGEQTTAAMQRLIADDGYGKGEFGLKGTDYFRSLGAIAGTTGGGELLATNTRTLSYIGSRTSSGFRYVNVIGRAEEALRNTRIGSTYLGKAVLNPGLVPTTIRYGAGYLPLKNQAEKALTKAVYGSEGYEARVAGTRKYFSEQDTVLGLIPTSKESFLSSVSIGLASGKKLTSSFQKEYEEMGYSSFEAQKKAESLSRFTRYTSLPTDVAFLTGIEGVSEAGGRRAFARQFENIGRKEYATGQRVLFERSYRDVLKQYGGRFVLPGAAEGTLSAEYISYQQTGKPNTNIDVLGVPVPSLAAGAIIGATTAPAVGTGIIYSQVAKVPESAANRALQKAGFGILKTYSNVADPFEKLGDINIDAIEAQSLRAGKVVSEPSFSFDKNSRYYSAGVGYRRSGGVLYPDYAKRTYSYEVKPTVVVPSAVPSQSKTSYSTRVSNYFRSTTKSNSPVNINERSLVPSAVPTNINTRTNVPTNYKTTIPTRVSTRVNIPTTYKTNVRTNVPVNVTTRTNVPVNVSVVPGFVPPLPSGGYGSGRRSRTPSGAKDKNKYSSSFFARFAGIKGTGKKRDTGYTGLETRGL